MRKARFNRFIAFGFDLVFETWMRTKIGRLHFSLPPGPLPDLPLLFIGNHMSNWDGFLFRRLQKKIRPGGGVYSIMLEPELRRFPVFRLLGGIGIEKGKPLSLRRALRTLRELRARNSRFCLTFFPQGRIWPSFRRPLEFRSGVERFIEAVAPVAVLPVGLHLEPLGGMKPHLFLSIGDPLTVTSGIPSAAALEGKVEAELDRLQAFLCRHGEFAPGRFEGEYREKGAKA